MDERVFKMMVNAIGDERLSIHELLMIFESVHGVIQDNLKDAKQKIVAIWKENGSYGTDDALERLKVLCDKDGYDYLEAEASVALSWLITVADIDTSMEHYALAMYIQRCLGQIELTRQLGRTIVTIFYESQQENTPTKIVH